MLQYFWRNCLKLRFKIDIVVMIIWSIVIIINSVLTLQVSTASLPHDCKPCEIMVVSSHTCSLHTCVCAGSHRVHTPKWLNQRQESVQLLGVFSSAPFRSGSVPNSKGIRRNIHFCHILLFSCGSTFDNLLTSFLNYKLTISLSGGCIVTNNNFLLEMLWCCQNAALLFDFLRIFS